MDKPIAYLDINIVHDLSQLANDLRSKTRMVSTEIRRINGMSVTVQRRRAPFAIFVDG